MSAPLPSAPKTIFPKVLSVSRATDVPAFYGYWLMERLRAGYSHWQNPFNAAQRQVVSFAEARALVFWSKNPAPLVPHLPEIADRGLKFYFQFTLNDYEREGLEPGVPSLGERIAVFRALSRICPVIWRYDPLIVGGELTIEGHLKRVGSLMERLRGYTEKLVFSFVDFYPRARENLNRFDARLREPTAAEKERFCDGLAELRDRIAPELRLATCAEEGIAADVVEKNSCVDPVLINKICGEEIYPPRPSLLGATYARDKGQRAACGCAPAKDIGSYRGLPCAYGCLYCYAGHGKIPKRAGSRRPPG